MDTRILVTYASQGGSTAGVAEAIGRALVENGAAVDVLPVQDVREVTAYQAVVLGSAVHSGQWLPEMTAFIERNQAHLRRIPTAVFQVCMMLATANESYRRMPADWFSSVRARIHPAAEASFAGALWPERYPKLTDKLGLRIFLAAIKVKAGDYRDWSAVSAWAQRIRPLLQCR